jgi:hypothetical protein
VKNLKIKVTFVGGERSGQKINVIIKDPLIFGLPIRRFDGEIYSPAKAAELAAKSVDLAMDLTFQLIKNDPLITRDQIQSSFINSMKIFMLNYSGTVDRTGSGSPKIIKEADYDWF